MPPKAAKSIRVLHLEDNEHDQIFVQEMLRVGGLDCELVAVKTSGDFETELRKNHYDLIISDYSMPSFDGLSGLEMAQKLSPDIPFIFFSGTIGEESAVESLKKGAADYVIKQRPQRLVPAIRRALQNVEAKSLLKQTEQKNREQAELLDKATDAILVCDLNNHIIYWNRGAEQIYGWTVKEVMGKDIAQVLFHGKSPLQIEQMTKAVEGSGEWTGEWREVTKANKPILIQCRITLIRNEQGRPKSLLFINTDITERKQLEEQFLRSQRLESLGTLVSGIAHDLNNTLTPVLIGVDVLRKTPAEMDNVLNMMEKNARRSAEMIKQMLAFARGDDTSKTLIPIEPLVNEMSKTLIHTFPKNIRFEIKVVDKPWPVSGVPTQIFQVLMNLCVNARDAMPNGGTLTMSLENITLDAVTAASIPDAKPGNYVCVGVADTGTGISPEQMEKLFRPFFTTKTPGKGTGLGLSTSAGIVKNHGGFMTVDSKVGQGTLFKFYLPTSVEAQPASPKSSLPRGNGEGVLVVDDESIAQVVARTALENYGYKVLTAANGLEAITSLSENRDNMGLVMIDIGAPLMGGVATITALRKIKPDIKIVICGRSKKPAEEIKERAQINGFIPKPITLEQLLMTVSGVLARNGK
jgi:two-component system, cell cycle sensor histidine kinase and response regulator CckA